VNIQVATEEYTQALRKGQKEYRELLMAGKPTNPLVLDEILPENNDYAVVDVGLVEIPSERIIGVKSAGRVTAFTASFLPLLDPQSEFGCKWINLCMAHLGETGITDPILCFEYLGNFYVQEGNKRVSLLRYFDSPRILGTVKRILPPQSEEPRIKAYYEFLEFYKASRIYTVQFRRPGDYARLTALLGKKSGEVWTEEERRIFRSYFHYFRVAFDSQNTEQRDILPEEALLVWLKLYPYQDLGSLTSAQLKKSIASLWKDLISTNEEAVTVQTKAEDAGKGSLVSRIVSTFDRLDVAFVHQLTPDKSTWVTSHEEGREHIEQVFGERITVRSYYDANTPEECERLIEQAVSDGRTRAWALAERILALRKENPKLKGNADRLLADLFLYVQWRVAWFCHRRSEQADHANDLDLAEKEEKFGTELDEANPALSRMRQKTGNLAVWETGRLMPREGLRLGLGRLDFVMARHYAQKVLQTDPDYTPANYAMGMSFLKEEQYNKAASYLRKCVEKNPDDIAAWNNLAVVYQRQGALDEALAAAERALEAAKALKTPEVRERAVKDVNRTRRFILDLQKSKEKR